MIAASAEPEFMMPLAVPEACGAMSMGIAHIGPMVISAKKNPAERHASDSIRSWVNISGRSDKQVAPMHTATIRLRARRKFPVRVKIRSVTMPPSESPITPARNTLEANSADLPRFKFWLCRKYWGIQLRNSHSVQP